MKKQVILAIGITMIMVAFTAQAQAPLDGYVIARSECPAYHSIKKRTNPGKVMTKENYAYPVLAKNSPESTHYMITMDAEPRPRWVTVTDGEHVIPTGSNAVRNLEKSDEYILAINWQPGFCETKPDKPECQSQTEGRFDAAHFTLHGLWPQPRGNSYCNVSPEEIDKDQKSRWSDLQAITLDPATREELNKVMPGTQSFLHRHEWIKHGTCYNGKTPQAYFYDSLAMMARLNDENSAIRELFAKNIGKKITSDQIVSAFDQTFGTGAGDKITITCKQDGNRILITEITIGLQGDLAGIPLGKAIMNARKVREIGCTAGIVDPVGLQ
ncbi:MAG: ribonuclease T [Desulfobacterales bacterium]|nr:MAG: ribonuclease T [Desulfobacterales bacterium]